MVFVAYEGLKAPVGIRAFIRGRRKDPSIVKKEVEGFIAGSRRGW